jgi:hypothetical protein
MQEDIPPATTDLNDHNALTNLWAQRIFTEEELSTLLESESSLDIDIEPQYDALTQRLSAINREMFDVYRVSTFLVHANNSHKHPARTLITDAVEATNTHGINHNTHSDRRTQRGEQHELPGIYRVLSLRIGHKRHPRVRLKSRPSCTHSQSGHGF